MDYVKAKADGSLLQVYVQPGARKTELVGAFNNRLKIKVAAPAAEDQANDALLFFLSKLFGVSKTSVEILRGKISRNKDIFFIGLKAESLSAKVSAVLSSSDLS